MATKEVEKKEDFIFSKDLKLTGLLFQGLITLRDPIRPNVKEAVRKVQESGIRVIVMTGDHRGTAEAVAREVGLYIEKKGTLDSSELKLLSDEDLKKRLPFLRVIFLVSPPY